MIKVKIVEGIALEADRLNETRGFKKIWNKYFLEKYIVVNDENYNIPVLEGNIYWAWCIGNGKVVLLEMVTES
jgi:hypothetical protein